MKEYRDNYNKKGINKKQMKNENKKYLNNKKI